MIGHMLKIADEYIITINDNNYQNKFVFINGRT